MVLAVGEVTPSLLPFFVLFCSLSFFKIFLAFLMKQNLHHLL